MGHQVIKLQNPLKTLGFLQFYRFKTVKDRILYPGSLGKSSLFFDSFKNFKNWSLFTYPQSVDNLWITSRFFVYFFPSLLIMSEFSSISRLCTNLILYPRIKYLTTLHATFPHFYPPDHQTLYFIHNKIQKL